MLHRVGAIVWRSFVYICIYIIWQGGLVYSSESPPWICLSVTQSFTQSLGHSDTKFLSSQRKMFGMAHLLLKDCLIVFLSVWLSLSLFPYVYIASMGSLFLFYLSFLGLFMWWYTMGLFPFFLATYQENSPVLPLRKSDQLQITSSFFRDICIKKYKNLGFIAKHVTETLS